MKLIAHGFLLSASIQCYCNTDGCIDTVTCNAGYACYAEMFNATATYGCIQEASHSGLCVRQGRLSEIHKDKPYLLLCCYKQMCNRINGEQFTVTNFLFSYYFIFSSQFATEKGGEKPIGHEVPYKALHPTKPTPLGCIVHSTTGIKVFLFLYKRVFWGTIWQRYLK